MNIRNILRRYLAPVLLSTLSAGYLAQAQVVNPSQPATGVPLAGTGISVAGQTVSINYGLGTQTYTGNFNVSGTLTAGTFSPASISTGALSATGAVTGAGFTSLFASPPAIGSTAAGTGAFTTLATSGTHTATGASVLNGAVSGTGIATYEANINHVQTVANVAALRALSSCIVGLLYADQGYYTNGDGGGAQYTCTSDTASTDNGGSILATAGAGNRLYLVNPSPVNVKQFGAKCDTSTDDSTALQNWINYVSATAGAGYIPAGICVHGTTLVFKNNGTYRGASRILTELRFTGTSADQAQINNAPNGSTAANITISDIYFHSTGAIVANFANLADVGSSYLRIERCQFFGSWASVILDQTEISSITDSNIVLASTYGIWLPNGPEHKAGNVAGFTNQLVITRNQFNSTTGVGTLIADDGGNDHSYIANNLNGGINSMKITSLNDGIITGGEFEAASASNILFGTLKAGGTAGGISPTVTIQSAYIQPAAAQAGINFLTGANNSVLIANNMFSSTVAPIIGVNFPTDLISQGNQQQSTGPTYTAINNVITTPIAFAPTWTASTTNPVLGNGTLTGFYTRDKWRVTINYVLTTGTTTTYGTGNWQFSIPFTSSANTTAVGTCMASVGATNFYVMAAELNASGTNILGFVSGTAVPVSATSPATWIATNTDNIQLTYMTANAIN